MQMLYRDDQASLYIDYLVSVSCIEPTFWRKLVKQMTPRAVKTF